MKASIENLFLLSTLQATSEESRDNLELLSLPAMDKARAGNALPAEQGQGDSATGKKPLLITFLLPMIFFH